MPQFVPCPSLCPNSPCKSTIKKCQKFQFMQVSFSKKDLGHELGHKLRHGIFAIESPPWPPSLRSEARSLPFSPNNWCALYSIRQLAHACSYIILKKYGTKTHYENCCRSYLLYKSFALINLLQKAADFVVVDAPR